MSYIDKILKGVEVQWKRLGDVIRLEKGKQLNKELLSEKGLYPAYNGGVSLSGYTDNYNYEENTTIISQGGASAGFVNFITTKFYANAHCYVILPKIDIVENRFIYHLLKQNQERLMTKQHGAGIPALRTSEILDIPIPVLPLNVQKEIVGILDKFTDLTVELKTELTAEITARKKQYSFFKEQLFNFNEVEVEREQLGVIGEFQRGKRFVKDDMISEGIPCIHYGEMYTYYGVWANESKSFLSKDHVEYKNLRVAENGNVVIVAAGETIEDIGMGTAWLGDEGVVIHDACFSFRSPLNPKYVAYFTRTKQYHDQIKKHISTGKISAINARGLEKALIPVPSLEEQERIVSILDKFDVYTNSIIENLPKEIELRKKQYEYYRGLLLNIPKNNVES